MAHEALDADDQFVIALGSAKYHMWPLINTSMQLLAHSIYAVLVKPLRLLDKQLCQDNTTFPVGTPEGREFKVLRHCKHAVLCSDLAWFDIIL